MFSNCLKLHLWTMKEDKQLSRNSVVKVKNDQLFPLSHWFAINFLPFFTSLRAHCVLRRVFIIFIRRVDEMYRAETVCFSSFIFLLSSCHIKQLFTGRTLKLREKTKDKSELVDTLLRRFPVKFLPVPELALKRSITSEQPAPVLSG